MTKISTWVMKQLAQIASAEKDKKRIDTEKEGEALKKLGDSIFTTNYDEGTPEQKARDKEFVMDLYNKFLESEKCEYKGVVVPEPPKPVVPKPVVPKKPEKTPEPEKDVDITDIDQNGTVNIVGHGNVVNVNVGNTPIPNAWGWGFTNPWQKNLTPEEAAKARDTGRDVANLLNNRTNKNEQMQIKDKIVRDVNSDNVMEFLVGYYQAKSENVGMDNFFEQMRSEYRFDASQDLMHKVAECLKDYIIENNGLPDDVREIEIILENNVFNKPDTNELDKLSMKYLPEEVRPKE